MKSKFLKVTVAFGLLSASAAVLASNSCCGSLECCLQMLACCF